MKQKRLVSVIGVLVLIISATAFITGCSQPNSNKGNTGNNSGNTGNNSGNTGNNSGNTGNNSGNTGNNSGNTGNNSGNSGNTGNTGGVPSALDEVIMVTGGTDNDLRTFYFSKGVVYYVQCYNAGVVAKSISWSYSGNSITGTSLGGTVICTVKPTKVTLFFDTGNSRDFLRITEGESLYNIIKNAPVNR